MTLCALLNRAGEEAEREARRALLRCCASTAWADGMLRNRPFRDDAAVLRKADEVWATLTQSDYLQAFSGHPRIGADKPQLRERFASTATWSSGEQAAVAHASEAVLDRLKELNDAYEARFGYLFIVCATGKSAQEMLQLLEDRMSNDPDTELAIAAAEQAKITKIRLEKLGT